MLRGRMDKWLAPKEVIKGCWVGRMCQVAQESILGQDSTYLSNDLEGELCGVDISGLCEPGSIVNIDDLSESMGGTEVVEVPFRAVR